MPVAYNESKLMNALARHIDKAHHHIYLKPGEIWVGQKPLVVSTVLGSCISATLFHPQTGSAAICHAMQPRCPHPHHCATDCIAKYKYADCAIKSISRLMKEFGLQQREIEVKLFGGASMISNRRSETTGPSVGEQNIRAAMETIQKCGLNLKVVNAGGTVGRKILFICSTGVVLMKRLKGVSP